MTIFFNAAGFIFFSNITIITTLIAFILVQLVRTTKKINKRVRLFVVDHAGVAVVLLLLLLLFVLVVVGPLVTINFDYLLLLEEDDRRRLLRALVIMDV